MPRLSGPLSIRLWAVRANATLQLSVIGLSLSILQPTSALANDCRWMATLEKPAEQVAQEVERRSGRKPTVSCGTGEDFRICHSCADRLTDEEWNQIRPMLAEPSYRRWHSSWHEGVDADSQANGKKHGITGYNDVYGESFFYGHREFVRALNANLAALTLPCIKPWTKLPDAETDPVWPTYDGAQRRAKQEKCKDPVLREKDAVWKRLSSEVDESLSSNRQQAQAQIDAIPSNLSLADRFKREEAINLEKDSRESAIKARFNERVVAAFGSLKAGQAANLDCAGELSAEKHDRLKKEIEGTQALASGPKGVTKLGSLGFEINSKWHGDLHARYNTIQPAKCSADPDFVMCDHMGSQYSAHVNMHFYKVHGLVDEIAERWLKANGYKTAKANCNKEPGCYPWKGKFVGTAPDYIAGTGCTIEQRGQILPMLQPAFRSDSPLNDLFKSSPTSR